MARWLGYRTRLLVLPGLTASIVLYVYVTWFEATGFDRVPGASSFDFPAQSQRLEANVRSIRAEGPSAENYVTEFVLKGFSYSGGRNSYAGRNTARGVPIQSPVTWSVVASLSQAVVAEVQEMFQDSYGEVNMHALGGGLIRHPSSGHLLIMHQLWLDNYYEKKQNMREGLSDHYDVFLSFKNSWHENYLIHTETDDAYKPLAVSRLMEIPTPTNLEFYQESDGPMGPKYVSVDGKLYLTFYTWAREKTGGGGADDPVAGRIHVWDLQRKVKIKLRVAGLRLAVAETGWAPFANNGSLCFVYSFEPLRVLRCRLPSGDCRLEHDGSPPPAAPAAEGGGGVSRSAVATALVEYEYPYYVGVLHEPAAAGGAIERAGRDDARRLQAHELTPRLIALCAEPWHVAYVSERLPANDTWLRSAPVVRQRRSRGNGSSSASPPAPFWHPTAVLLVDADTLDVSAQLNDHSAYVVRLQGVRRLMAAALPPSRGRLAAAARG